MKLGPRYKIAKRLGAPIFEKTQTQKFLLSQARRDKAKKTGSKRPKQFSDYKKQLLEVQKLRLGYGITERQLSGYIKEAMRASSGSPAENLVAALESRLDNVVYRLGLVRTRRAGRQLVAHGHVTVGGKRTTVPSHRLAPGAAFAIREGSRSSVLFENLTERLAEHTAPSWLSFDLSGLSGAMTSLPTMDSVDLIADISAVLEFYSR
jgi:small subunit ribosomal protein S4